MCECYADEIRREIAEQERKAIVASILEALKLATETPASVVRVVGTFKLLVVLAMMFEAQ